LEGTFVPRNIFCDWNKSLDVVFRNVFILTQEANC